MEDNSLNEGDSHRYINLDQWVIIPRVLQQVLYLSIKIRNNLSTNILNHSLFAKGLVEKMEWLMAKYIRYVFT